MSAFSGTWSDEAKAVITVKENAAKLVTATYSNGRGPFQGFEIDLYAPVLSVNFTDEKPHSGVLAGKTIRWSNGTTWTKT